MDFRYALRVLARTPGFTLMAVATLALGIGINTVVFTVYDSVAFHQLGVRAPGEIERLQWSRGSYANRYPNDLFTWQEYRRLTRGGRSYTAVVATSDPEAVLCDGETAHVRFVSGNYFEALGVNAVIGRAGVVVSNSFWERRLRSDPYASGRVLRVGDASLTILAVAPASFEGTGSPPQVPDLWISAEDQPLALPGLDWVHDSAAREWQLLGRRAPGVTHRQAEAGLAVVAASWPLEANKPVRLSSLPATFFQTDSGEFEGFAVVCGILLIAVLLVLTMGCINLVNLIVARNAARGHEIALRMALGASRFRLMRQLCSESLLLGIAGGAFGLLLSFWSCRWLSIKAVQFFHELSFRMAIGFTPHWRTFLWSAALSILTGIAVGLGPALRASRRNVSGMLRQSGSAGAVDVSRRRNVLVTLQVASCLILLTAAGLLFRGAARSPATDPGFDVAHTMLASIDARRIALSKAIDRIRAMPGVQSVSWADRPPFLGHGMRMFTSDTGSRLNCLFNGVSRDYFDTLGIPLLAGRNFTREEVDAGAPVILISDSTARHLWPGANPLGHRIDTSTVIGVVKTVRSTYLSKPDEGYVYLPKPLPDATYADLLIRTAGAPQTMFRRLSDVLPAADMVAIGRTPMKLERWMAEGPAIAAAILGGLALLLACLGIFGVVSRLVALRTREIGIRIALGAQKSDVAELIGRQTMTPVLWGAGLGLAGAFGVSALLRALIVMPDVPDLTYGAGAFDPVTFAGVFIALAVTVAVAGFLPMRRAVRVEPAEALRDQ